MGKLKTTRSAWNLIRTLPERLWIQDHYAIPNGETRYCDIGWFLHKSGVPDEHILNGVSSALYNVGRDYEPEASRLIGLIPGLNDASVSFQTNFDAVRAFLFHDITYSWALTIATGKVTLRDIKSCSKRFRAYFASEFGQTWEEYTSYAGDRRFRSQEG